MLELIQVEGAFPDGASANHPFTLDTDSGVIIQTSGIDVTCPQGVDTIIELYNSDRELLESNDDSRGTLCSKVEVFLSAGDYEVDVLGFNGSGVDEYVLTIYVVPTLNAGSSCNRNTPQLGTCASGLTCIPEGICAEAVAPVLDSANAYRGNGRLIFQGHGRDVHDDVVGMQVTLYDLDFNVIQVDGSDSFVLPLADVRDSDTSPENQLYISVWESPESVNVSGAEIVLIDSGDLTSASQLLTIDPLPAADLGEECDITLLTGDCGPFVCAANAESLQGGICIASLPTQGESCTQEVGCEAGLLCLDQSQSFGDFDFAPFDGTCAAACNSEVDETGCDVGELCVFYSIDFDTFEFFDVCIGSDNCEPGNENAACGEGDFSCTRIGTLSQCTDLTDVLPENQVELNEPCGEEIVCASGLVCELGSCRAPCQDGNVCDNDAECTDLSPELGSPYSYCLNQCDVLEQTCPDGEVCSLLAANETQIYGECIVGTEGEGTNGDTCIADPTETTIYGDCQANHACIPLSEGNDPECIALCQPNNAAACTGDYQGCSTQADNPNFGFCIGDCDVFTNGGCEPNNSCLLSGEGNNAQGTTSILGFCVENLNPGAVPTGGSCVGAEDGTSDCAPGHFCADFQDGAGSLCFQLCESNSGNRCQPGTACTPVFTDLEEVGFCLAP
jgi:hypothetical protein